MEKVLKGYIFRLYSNDKQIELIEKSFGCSKCGYQNKKVKDLSIRER